MAAGDGRSMSRRRRAQRRESAAVDVPRAIRPLLRAVGEVADQAGMCAYAVGGCVRNWLLGVMDVADIDLAVEGNAAEVASLLGCTLNGQVTIHRQFGTATVRFDGPAAGGSAGRRVGEPVPARPLRLAGGMSAPGGGGGGGATHADRPTQAGTEERWAVAQGRAAGCPNDRALRIDVATCRREFYAKPAAYPRVAAGTIEEDLARRDFTINAMAASVAPGRFGALIDPFGGTGDLRGGRLRILHARSFLDDPSRILRGVRFLVRFGLRWERATRRALREAVAAGALGWLNTGRLRREFDRMCDEPNPRTCFEELRKVFGQDPRASEAILRLVAASGARADALAIGRTLQPAGGGGATGPSVRRARG